jgi:alkanesulfonate monooxygenase SsuD/methylene tetrahydromethanopterin reductase-like flavin-dependent oxidoreductase (luciferase family)
VSALSLGLPGATPHRKVASIARRIEAAGFHGLWLNDTARGDSLAGLAAAAEVTSTLRLGTVVIPVDRRAPAEIATAAARLPAERLTLGIGSGELRHPLGPVEEAVDRLREATTAEIAVGALGPRMRQLAASRADAVLLNWLTPQAAADAVVDLRVDAEGRPVRAVLYVRTAVDENAVEALRAEERRYEGYPAYAANFVRIGSPAIDTTLAPGATPAEFEAFASPVDELVLRAITPTGSLAELERFVDEVAEFAKFAERD